MPGGVISTTVRGISLVWADGGVVVLTHEVEDPIRSSSQGCAFRAHCH
jgi:hypothetical protein